MRWLLCFLLLVACERLQQQKHPQQKLHVIDPLKADLHTFPKGVLENLPREFSVLQIDDRGIRFFSPLPWKKLAHRDRLLLKTLKKVAARGPLPAGEFIISTGDAVEKAWKWPVLTYASTRALVDSRAVVLLPDCDAQRGYADLFSQVDSARKLHPWDSKESKVFWRGATTGIYYSKDNWLDSPRVRLISAVRDLPFVDAGFTRYLQFLEEDTKIEFAKQFPLKNEVSVADSLRFKYLVDVDGNSCSFSRMAWILYSGSLLFKHESDNTQWYYPQLREGEHYLKISRDFANLAEQFSWAESNPIRAKEIAARAHALAITLFSEEAILDAMRKAFFEYQGLLEVLTHDEQLRFAQQ